MSDQYKIQTVGECTHESPIESALFIGDDDRVLVDPCVTACRDCEGGAPASVEQAGPREKLFFDPASTSIGIVTCGGLCPGLNDVIRGIVMVAWHRYGVRNIVGFRYGYEGLVDGVGQEPMPLTPDVVEDIHQDGGTILGNSRGHQEPSQMVDCLEKRRIDILFAVGGDGTQAGAMAVAAEIAKRGLSISVVGIPKTIDNDIAFTERTFGFETAVSASQSALSGAHQEAKGIRNGIGLVKLMGRESGFVAAYASLASSDVNAVLVPESPFSIEKLMDYLQTRLAEKQHAVIVVAEGAGQDLVAASGTDASGNVKFGDIGLFLKSTIGDELKKRGVGGKVKYIDPSYIIRSAPASADDSVFCLQLAQNAVHAAMAGRTAMVISLWNGKFVHIPTELSVQQRKRIDTKGLLWQSVLDNTGQPATLA